MNRLMRLAGEALRSLWGSRLHALLMMIGIVIGISSVTVIYEIGAGARERVVGMMASIGFGADALYVTSGGGRVGVRRAMAGVRTLTLGDVTAVSRLDNVDLVSPQLSLRRDRISAGERHSSSSLTGVTADYAVARRWEIAQGRFLEPQDDEQRRRVAVVGATTARDLFGDVGPLGRQIRVGNVPLLVVGVLAAKGGMTGGGHDRDDRVLTPLSTAMRRISKEDKISGLRVGLLAPERRQETVEEITQLLRARHKLAPGVPDDFLIVTPEALVAIITRQSQAMVRLLTFISAVSLFVSGIVIMNIMLVSVTERAHEIGVRRALGARRADIMAQFLMESVLVALAGGGCGLGLGLALSAVIALALDIPTAFSPLGFGLAFLFSAVVGLVFGLAPARHAAALAPVESLR